MTGFTVVRPIGTQLQLLGDNSVRNRSKGRGKSNNPVPTSPPEKSKKMTITPDSQNVGIVVPYAPVVVTKSNVGASWTEVTRVGQGPLLVQESALLPQLSFQLFFGYVDNEQSVKPLLNKMEQYAALLTPLRLDYSSIEEGLWHIMSLSYSTVQRREDHEPTQVTVDVVFIQNTTGFIGVGPLTGGVGAGKEKSDDGNTIEYKVQQGDTLHNIAVKFFKDASRWNDIAKWNDITKKPGVELFKGRKLEIRLPKKHAVAQGNR